jgi:hypothetical protein
MRGGRERKHAEKGDRSKLTPHFLSRLSGSTSTLCLQVQKVKW